jgi:pimeloyl-ACP methyl ester carboxylesterase
VPALKTADGRKLTYLELGTGPPLICHPGGPGIPAAIQVRVMPGIGHMPWVEEADGFREALFDFLS